jgi:hypothetical protein
VIQEFGKKYPVGKSIFSLRSSLRGEGKIKILQDRQYSQSTHFCIPIVSYATSFFNINISMRVIKEVIPWSA